MELIKALGISWPTLISQLINFGILYFLLKKFALEGLLEAITNRQQEIDSGLQKAKAADDSLAQAKAEQEEILGQARQEAQTIINQARQVGRDQEKTIVESAKVQAQKIVADGEKQVAISKSKMLLEVKAELADIIATGVETMVGQKVKPEEVTSSYLQAGMEA